MAPSQLSPLLPRVSTVIVNWNRKELLRACLDALRRQTFQNLEVIVVDNGSTDGSAEMLAGPEFRCVRCIRNTENRGFCAANNQGVRQARGEYVALLNNDAEPDPRWIEELVRVLDAHPDAGMAASKILFYDDPGVIDKAGHLIFPDGQNRGRGTGERDTGQYERLEETAWPDGCAALYRRSLLEELGGFDEDFFAYADDAELGLRARIAGWRCLYVPTAVVRHRVGSTLGPYSEQRLFLIERNRVWLAAKLFPWRLLVWNPFYFGLRAAASVFAACRGRGELRRAASSISAIRLLQCMLKANWAALRGLPAMLRKRRSVDAIRKLSSAEVARTIRRFQIPLADLASKSR